MEWKHRLNKGSCFMCSKILQGLVALCKKQLILLFMFLVRPGFQHNAFELW